MRIKELEKETKPVNAMKQDILDNWLSAKKGSKEESAWSSLFQYELFYITKDYAKHE